jgi:lycopene cyclase CruP
VLQEPGFVPKLMVHVGLGPLLGWVGHVSALAAFTAVHKSAGALKGLMPNLSPLERYRLRRLLDAMEYGSGADFKP